MATSLLETARRAKARLEDFSINEVSLVDQAANLRKLVVIKRKPDMNEKTKKADAGVKLPSAAKQALMDGIGQVLDKITALGAIVGDAETDDTAAVPDSLTTALQQIGDMCEGMATQYAAPGQAPPDAETPASPDGTQPDPGAPPPAGKSAGSPAAKALPAELKDGEGMKQIMRDGDSLKTLLHKSIAVAHAEMAAFEALDKAGRKMAGARYKKLSELHDNLGKLLNELAYDDAADAAGAGEAADKAKKKPVPPPAKGDETPAAKSVDGATDAPQDETAELLKQLKGSFDKLGERLGAVETTVSAVAKAAPVSNAGTVDAPIEKNDDDKNKVEWPVDMSAALASRRSAANGAANGTRR